MEALFLLSRLDDTSTPPPSLRRLVSLFLRTCSRLCAVTLHQQPVALVVGWLSMHKNVNAGHKMASKQASAVSRMQTTLPSQKLDGS